MFPTHRCMPPFDAVIGATQMASNFKAHMKVRGICLKFDALCFSHLQTSKYCAYTDQYRGEIFDPNFILLTEPYQPWLVPVCGRGWHCGEVS